MRVGGHTRRNCVDILIQYRKSLDRVRVLRNFSQPGRHITILHHVYIANSSAHALNVCTPSQLVKIQRRDQALGPILAVHEDINLIGDLWGGLLGGGSCH